MNKTKIAFAIFLTFSLCLLSCTKNKPLPQEALARYINAKLAYQNGNLEKSFKEFSEIASDYKDFKEAGFMAGKSAFFLGKYNEAEGLLKKAWTDKPEYFDAGFWLGRCLIAMQRENEAMEIFVQLNKNNSKDFRVLHQMALLSMEEEDLLTAIDYLKRGLLLRDELAQTALSLAQIYYSQGLLEEANDFLTEAKTIATKNGSVRAAIDEISIKINK